jgi:hypothetical protein
MDEIESADRLAGLMLRSASIACDQRARRRSLRAIAAELATAGYLNENGRPFARSSVKAMIATGVPR